MTEPLIDVRGVSRSFGTLLALDQVSVQVHPGEVVGLLGHNGAGKTTLLRIINGLLQPDAGGVRVFGLDPGQDGSAVRSRTGVVTESLGLDDHLTVTENLKAFAAMYGVPGAVARRRIPQLLEQVEVPARFLDGATQQLSAGLRQRVAIARALVHDPDVLLLDEPTSNLDPLIARKIRSIVRAAASDGKAVVVCTHNLPEAQATCDRIVILREGRVLAAGSLSALTREVGGGTVVGLDPGEAQAALAALERAGFAGTTLDIGNLHLAATDGQIPRIVRTLVESGFNIHRVEPQVGSLEELYVQLHTVGAS